MLHEKMNVGIIIGIIILIAYGYSMNHAKSSSPLHENVEESTQAYLDKQKKYLEGGTLEYVSFSCLKSSDDEKTHNRHGILYINPQALGTVIVCHGFMCDKFDIAFMRRSLFSHYNVMMFDFRAHGENVSDDHCCTFGKDEALDVVGAVNYLKSRQDLAQLPRIAYGFSMGAVAAIQAQSSDNSLFQALVLDCPYDHSKNIIKRSLDNLNFTIFGYTFELPGRQLLERFAFNYYVQTFIKMLLKMVANMDALSTRTHIYPLSPADSIKKITIPCFFIHCKNDEKVPVESAEALYHNAAGYKRLWITQGRRHFDSIFYNPEKYVYKINKFIRQVLNHEIEKKSKEKIYSDFKIV